MGTTKVSGDENSSWKIWFRTVVSQTALESGDEYSRKSQEWALGLAAFHNTVSVEASCESCRELLEEYLWLLMKDDNKMNIKNGQFFQ